MLDPLSSLALACNVLQILDYGAKAVSNARQIHKEGWTEDDARLESLLSSSSILFANFPAPESSASADEKELYDIVQQCAKINIQLQAIIQKDRPRDTKSFRQLAKAMWKALIHHEAKSKLQQQLKNLESQLALYLACLNRQKMMKLLNEIPSGQRITLQKITDLADQIAALKQMQTSLESSLQTTMVAVSGSSRRLLNHIFQQKVSDVLYPRGANERYVEVSIAHERTFNWILESDHAYAASSMEQTPFVQWLVTGKDIFHISGKLGSGKSTLMKFLWSDPRTRPYLQQWAGTTKLILSKFFFWRHGNQFQRSLNGLYRKILYDLLCSRPELLPVFHRVLLEVSEGLPGAMDVNATDLELVLGTVELTTRTLKYAVSAMFRHTSRTSGNEYKYCVFIDGLDEFEETEDADYKDLIANIEEWTQNSEHVKVCLSSREYNSFMLAFEEKQRLRLQDLTRKDMTVFVTQRLSDLRRLGPDAAQNIMQKVLEKADGVFLWVALVVKMLRKGFENEQGLSELERKLEVVPAKLKDLLAYLLDSIDEGDRFKAYSTFVVAMSMQKEAVQYGGPPKGFHLLEYSFLEEIWNDPASTSWLPLSYSPITGDRYASRMAIAQKQLNGLCQSLLECTKSRHIVFTHRSVHEFLHDEYASVMKKQTRGFIWKSARWKIYFAFLAYQPTLYHTSCTSDPSHLAGAVANILTCVLADDCLAEVSRWVWLDRLDTLTWSIQHCDVEWLNRASGSIPVVIFFAMVLDDHERITYDLDFHLYSPRDSHTAAVASLLHLAAGLGLHEYVVHKLNTCEMTKVGLLGYRLFQAIQLALENGRPEATRMLPGLLQTFKASDEILLSITWGNEDLILYEFRSSAWLDFLNRLLRRHYFIRQEMDDISSLGSEVSIFDMKEAIQYNMEMALEAFLEYGADCRMFLAMRPVVLDDHEAVVLGSAFGTTSTVAKQSKRWMFSLLDRKNLRYTNCTPNSFILDNLQHPADEQQAFWHYLYSQGGLVSLKSFFTDFLKPSNLPTLIKLIDSSPSAALAESTDSLKDLKFSRCLQHRKLTSVDGDVQPAKSIAA